MSDPQSGHRIYDSDYLADQTNYRNAKNHTKKCQFSNFTRFRENSGLKIAKGPTRGPRTKTDLSGAERFGPGPKK